jgi:hypothetical protein
MIPTWEMITASGHDFGPNLTHLDCARCGATWEAVVDGVSPNCLGNPEEERLRQGKMTTGVRLRAYKAE